MNRPSALRTWATISKRGARITAAARPSSRPVAASCFVSNRLMRTECFSSVAPVELFSNRPKIPRHFAIASSSIVLYMGQDGNSISLTLARRCSLSWPTSASHLAKFSSSSLGCSNFRARISSARRWFTWTRRLKAFSLKPSSSTETKSEAMT